MSPCAETNTTNNFFEAFLQFYACNLAIESIGSVIHYFLLDDDELEEPERVASHQNNPTPQATPTLTPAARATYNQVFDSTGCHENIS
jgi:hypothetical protein